MNTLSDYFTDEELETQLKTHLKEEEMHTINFKTLFHEIQDEGDCFSLRLKGKRFLIDKITGTVTEAIK
jgi:hypothetical protein